MFPTNPDAAQETGNKNSLLTTTATLPGELWGRLPKPRQRFNGLSRTTLLEACERGDVRSCVLKKRHAIRGIRLIYLPSLYEYLERLAMETKKDIVPDELAK